MKRFADGLIAFVKRECPTCVMIEPVLRQLAAGATPLTVYSQDDPSFPARIQAVPTLVRITDGAEAGRALGWNRAEWEAVSRLNGLGPGLPENRPGCGS